MVKFKNRTGSTLVLTLIIFAVLMILGTFLLGFMVTENKQAMYHQNKTQAYYIARSGAVAVEAAIMQMSEDNLESLKKELEKGEVIVDEIIINDNKAKVVVNLDDEELVITSLGILSLKNSTEVTDTVTKVMEYSSSSEKQIDIKYAVFSDGELTLDNSARIDGDVGTNNIVDLGNSSKVTGTINIMKGNVIKSGNSSSYGSKEDERTEPINYIEFVFPKIPSNTSSTNLIIGNSDTKTINNSANYRNIEVGNSGKLYIDASKNDIILNVKEISINNSGKMIIKGNNKVEIYVETISLGNSSTMEYDSGNSLLSMYQYGNSKVELSNSIKVKMNLYIRNAVLNLKIVVTLLGIYFLMVVLLIWIIVVLYMDYYMLQILTLILKIVESFMVQLLAKRWNWETAQM